MQLTRTRGKGIADGDVERINLQSNFSRNFQRGNRELLKRLREKIKIVEKIEEVEVKERKKPKYTPLSKDKIDQMQFYGCKNAPELTDGQISKLVGSTKGTVSLIEKVIGIF